MKKYVWFVVVAALMIGIGGFGMKDFGYERIEIPDGTLYAQTEFAATDTLVILVAGSGPTDMDGNSPLVPGRNDSLAQLARGLKQRGFSTLRYDKRTAGRSASSIRAKEPDFDLFVSDCVACIRYAKQKGYNRIYLAGHSQGALVAMLAAQRESVDGVISISGAGFSVDVTLERQLTAQFGADSVPVSRIRSLREGIVDETADPNDPIFSPRMQEFLLTWMKYNPSEVIASLDCPVLIVQGSTDLQVDISEFNALSTARAGATAVFIDGMNHVLKTVDGKDENAAAYTDPSFNVDARLIESIVQFLSQSQSR